MRRFDIASVFVFVAFVGRIQAQNKTSLPADFYTGVSSDTSGSYLTAVVRNGPIYYSDDRGVSWKVSNAPNPGNYLAVAASSTGQYVIAASTSTTLVSSNYAQHFTTAATIDGSSNSVAVSGTGQYMVSISASASSKSCVSYSSNYGTSFTLGLGPNNDATTCVGVGIDYSGTYVVLSVNGQGLWVSNDVTHSSSWRLTYEYDVEISAIAFGGTSFYAGYSSTPAYVVQSSDSGYTWTVKGSVYDQIRSIAVDSSGVDILIASSYSLYLSEDSGLNYKRILSAPAVYNCAMNADTTLTIFTEGNYKQELNVFVGNPQDPNAPASNSNNDTTNPVIIAAIVLVLLVFCFVVACIFTRLKNFSDRFGFICIVLCCSIYLYSFVYSVSFLSPGRQTNP